MRNIIISSTQNDQSRFVDANQMLRGCTFVAPLQRLSFHATEDASDRLEREMRPRFQSLAATGVWTKRPVTTAIPGAKSSTRIYLDTMPLGSLATPTYSVGGIGRWRGAVRTRSL